MRFQRSPGQLYKADLAELLQARFPAAILDNRLSLVELLERAVAAGLLTDEEIAASLPKRTQTVTAYLKTFVKDAVLQGKIDKYVYSWSLAWSYGSRLLNLGAIDTLGGRIVEDDALGRPCRLRGRVAS